MKYQTVALLFLLFLTGSEPTPPSYSLAHSSEIKLSRFQENNDEETQFQARSLALRQRLAAEDLEALETWWRKQKIGDPHKYLLPVILARLSLPGAYDSGVTWEALQRLHQAKPNLYHFRSIFDIRIFFQFRQILPNSLEADYRSQLDAQRVQQWNESGTENHMFMQRVSGLALMDGSGWANAYPATAETNEAWLRSQINKFLTIGQGEFHSSTYYGYAIAGLLNLYDFAQTPQRQQLAQAALDWLATNMALRLSWGTTGGAESRGFDRGTWQGSGLAALAWVWWGDNPDIASQMSTSVARVALPAALSTYRPPSHLRAIARKDIPLPFTLRASHPAYYSYHQDNQFWETFYITPDYSIGTLINPQRSYQVKGTINAQYATYKLVIRDQKGDRNAILSLGGTYHSPLATGSSPGDQYLQHQGTVLYQLQLTSKDLSAGVPPRSHLVLPAEYGAPKQYQNWYIWQIHNTWLCARPWGEHIEWRTSLSPQPKFSPYQVLVAEGNHTAWITEVVSLKDYPHFSQLTQALHTTQTQLTENHLTYQGLPKPSEQLTKPPQLSLIYTPNSGKGRSIINKTTINQQNWPVLDSPVIQQPLYQGTLQYLNPGVMWELRATPTGPAWYQPQPITTPLGDKDHP